jgi:hypothetical protein
LTLSANALHDALSSVVPRGTHLGGADEVHEDVLVHQRDPEPIRGDRAGDRLDPLRACESL